MSLVFKGGSLADSGGNLVVKGGSLTGKGLSLVFKGGTLVVSILSVSDSSHSGNFRS